MFKKFYTEHRKAILIGVQVFILVVISRVGFDITVALMNSTFFPMILPMWFCLLGVIGLSMVPFYPNSPGTVMLVGTILASIIVLCGIGSYMKDKKLYEAEWTETYTRW